MKELIIILASFLIVAVAGFFLYKLFKKPRTSQEDELPVVEEYGEVKIDPITHDPKFRMLRDKSKTEYELDLMAFYTAQKMLELEKRAGLYR